MPATMTQSKSKRTTSHNVIRKWAEARCGRPATVKSTGTTKKPGILKIDFPGYRGRFTLQELTWDEFFKKFDESDLEFLYQEKTANGNKSRFNRFVKRDEKSKSKSRKK